MAPRNRRSREVDVLYTRPNARRMNRRVIERPRRPPTGYNIFVKQFFARRAQRNEGGKSVITQAGQRWSQLSREQKNKYIRQGARARDRSDYESAMKRYRHEVSAQKGPSRPFVDYYSRYYQTLSPMEIRASTVNDLVRRAAENWKELPESTKEEYTTYFKQQYQLHLQGHPRASINQPLIPEPQAIAMSSQQAGRASRGRSPSMMESRRRQRQSRSMEEDDEVSVVSAGEVPAQNSGPAPDNNASGSGNAASELSSNETDQAGLNAHEMNRRRRRRRRSAATSRQKRVTGKL